MMQQVTWECAMIVYCGIYKADLFLFQTAFPSMSSYTKILGAQ